MGAIWVKAFLMAHDSLTDSESCREKQDISADILKSKLIGTG